MTDERIELTTLSNGVRVVTETVTHVQSVSLGIWVGVGSRDETAPVRGITHFIEHMLFKGTASRDARQIADEIESRGGNLNAFTDKEYTCYYARALSEHAPVVMDVLSDMLLHSLLEPEELARERNVVLEEIKRYEDTPDDHVHDLFTQTLWSPHALGKSVIGSSRTVSGLERPHLAKYIETHYTPDRIVVAAAGNVPHAEVVHLAEKHLGGLKGKTRRKALKPPSATGKSRLQRKRTEQVHFCLGGQAYRQEDPDRYVLTLIDMVLGGNMSSRLFQEIREKRGLVYAIGSYQIAYSAGGCFAVYGGTSLQTYEQVIDLVRHELKKVRSEGLLPDEIAKAKTQIRGGLVLGLESMSSRMMRMGKSMMYFGRVIPLDEILGRIEAIQGPDILRVAGTVFAEDQLSLAAIGPFPKGTAA